MAKANVATSNGSVMAAMAAISGNNEIENE